MSMRMRGSPEGLGKIPITLRRPRRVLSTLPFAEPELTGKVLFEQDGPLIGEEGKGVLPLAACALLEGGPGDLGPDGPVEEGVDAQEPDEIAVGEFQPPLHDGGEGRDGRVADEIPQDRFVHGPCEPFEGVGGFPPEKFHRLGKAGEGRLGREGHADDGGHPAGDPEELKQAEAAPPVEIAKEGSGNGSQKNLGERLQAKGTGYRLQVTGLGPLSLVLFPLTFV